jgi:hypothetical protein
MTRPANLPELRAAMASSDTSEPWCNGATVLALLDYIAELEVALRPLARVAEAIDSAAKYKRPDSVAIWFADAWRPEPTDLLMGHARAARRVLAGTSA